MYKNDQYSTVAIFPETAGEVLEGNELIDSQLAFNFKKDVPKQLICKDEMNEARVKKFRNAIKNHYWYELFLDDLPIWGFVGEYVSEGEEGEKKKDDEQLFIYTHKSFDLTYNGDRIIQVGF